MKVRVYVCLFLLMNSATFARKICTISIPKCGTHMMINLMNLMCDPLVCTTIGIQNLALLTDEEINANVKLIPSHAIASPHNIDVVMRHKNQITPLFIYRDPRDQIVSMAHWIIKNPVQWPQFSFMSLECLITWLIIDSRLIYNFNDMGAPEFTTLAGITDFYNLYLPWAKVPGMYVTTFEKLVGPQGGGDFLVQCEEIRKIGMRVGVLLMESEVISIAQRLFGNTGTFREGKIGSWKTHFTDKHKELFKHYGGQLLIDLGYEKDLEW